MTVDGNATIGQATAATNRELFINGVASKASRISFQESGTNRWLIGNGAASENGNFEIYDATNGNNFVITPTGNVGINNSSPVEMLTIGDTSDTNVRIQFLSSTSGANTIQFGDGTSAAAYRGYINYTHSDDALAFAAAGSEVMRLESGNVGINNTVASTIDSSSGLGNLVVGSGSGVEGITIYTGSSNYGALNFADATSGGGSYAGYIRFDHATDSFGHFIGNTERMRINSSGNVGIGTDSPTTKLHVADAADSNAQIRLNGSTSAVYSRLYSDNNGVLAISTDVGNQVAGSYMMFEVKGSERMRIDASGNVGIGTNSPLSKLNVKGTQGNWRVDPDSVSDEIQVLSTTAANDGFRNFRLRSNEIIFETGGSEAMRINSSGNLLIGKDDDDATTDGIQARGIGAITIARDSVAGDALLILNKKTNDGTIAEFRKDGSTVGSIGVDSSDLVSDGSATDHAGLRFMDSQVNPRKNGALSNGAVDLGGNIYRWKDLYLSGNAYADNFIGTNDTDTFIAMTGSNVMRFFTANSEAARLDSSGNLLVGTTSATVSADAGFRVLSNRPATTQADSTSGTTVYEAYSTGAGAFRFYVDMAGTVHATSTSITAISDESLKENIRDLDKGLDTIKALKPRRFDWKNGDGNDIMGFVAQEVEDVLPELVHDYKLNETETKLGLKMGDMIPSLVKAIQEQQDLIESLTARVAQLEGAN